MNRSNKNRLLSLYENCKEMRAKSARLYFAGLMEFIKPLRGVYVASVDRKFVRGVIRLLSEAAPIK